MVGYYFRNVALPSHMYSYNLIFEPPLIFNNPYGNKYFSVAIRPAPKIKISMFPINLDNAFSLNIFFLGGFTKQSSILDLQVMNTEPSLVVWMANHTHLAYGKDRWGKG
jgi:hypothetical protein